MDRCKIIKITDLCDDLLDTSTINKMSNYCYNNDIWALGKELENNFKHTNKEIFLHITLILLKYPQLRKKIGFTVNYLIWLPFIPNLI